MKKIFSSAFLTFFAVIFFFGARPAQAVFLDFEGLVDFEQVTNQFNAQGVQFSNATAALAFPFGSLNEINFPPVSGVTLLTNEIDTDFDTFPDSTGDMGISFGLGSFSNVSAYLTYADYGFTGDPLSVMAFSPVDTITPILTLTVFENIGSSQLISFSGIGPIGSLLLQGGAGSYFTLDNLSFFQVQNSTIVPEPSTWVLMCTAFLVYFLGFKYKISRF